MRSKTSFCASLCALLLLAQGASAQENPPQESPGAFPVERLELPPVEPMRRLYFSAGWLLRSGVLPEPTFQLFGLDARLGAQFSDAFALYGGLGVSFAPNFDNGTLRVLAHSEWSFGSHFALGTGLTFEHTFAVANSSSFGSGSFFGVPLLLAYYIGAAPLSDREYTRHQFRIGMETTLGVSARSCVGCADPISFGMSGVWTLGYVMR